MRTNHTLTSTLNNLTEILIAQEHVYLKFSQTVADPVLAVFFQTKSKEIRSNIYELRKVVYDMGGNPVYKSSFTRVLLRKWAAIKILVVSNNHFQLLQQLQHEEEFILEAYKDLSIQELPRELRGLLMRQTADVRRNISQIRQLHNHMDLALPA